MPMEQMLLGPTMMRLMPKAHMRLDLYVSVRFFDFTYDDKEKDPGVGANRNIGLEDSEPLASFGGVDSFVVREEDGWVCGDCSMVVAGARCGSWVGESLEVAADG
jgi:hypothetical protein